MQDQTRPNLTPLELETIVEKAKEDKTKNSIRTNEELIFPKKKKNDSSVKEEKRGRREVRKNRSEQR